MAKHTIREDHYEGDQNLNRGQGRDGDHGREDAVRAVMKEPGWKIAAALAGALLFGHAVSAAASAAALSPKLT